MQNAIQSFGCLVIVACVAGLLHLLYFFVRFSIISWVLTRGASQRLRKPNAEGIEQLVGFAPSAELIHFYNVWPHLEEVEFELVDNGTNSRWFVGGFIPLTRADACERRNVAGKHGLPIADDLNKGTYFVNADGSIDLWSPNVPGGRVRVAESIERLAEFEYAHPQSEEDDA